MPKYKTYDDVPVKKKYKTYDDVKVKTHWEEDVSQPLDGDSAANNPIAPTLILAKRDGNAAAAKKLMDNAPYVQAGRDGINAYADAVAEIERQDAAAKDAAVQATIQPMGYGGLSKALRDGSMPKKKNAKVKETRREGNPKYNDDYVSGVDYLKFRPYDDVEKELADVQARRDTDFNARFPEAGELVQRSIGGKDADADRQLRELAQQYADENAAYDARIAELKKEAKDSKNKTVLQRRERATKQTVDTEQTRFSSPELRTIDEKIKNAEAELAAAESAQMTVEDAERALREYEDELRANGVSEQYFGEDSHYIELAQAAGNAKKSAASQKNAASADLYALRGAKTLATLPEASRDAIFQYVACDNTGVIDTRSFSGARIVDLQTGKRKYITKDEFAKIRDAYDAAIAELKAAGASQNDIDRMLTAVRYSVDRVAAAGDSTETAKQSLKYPITMSTVSVIMNLSSGLFAGVGEAARAAGNIGRADGYEKPMNINGAAYAPVRATNDIRGTIAERIEEGNGFGGKVGSFAYQTLMSTADSVVASVLGNVGGAAAIGGSAFASAIVDAKESGVSDEQALMTGICAGIFETLFERVSIGNFNKLKEVPPATLRDVALNIVKSTVVNASEEGATEIANILADTIINGDYSVYAKAYQSYLAAGKSEKEAERLAKQDMIKQVGMAAFGGAVQGFFMGGIGTTWGYFGNRDANRAAGAYFTDENGRINAENRNALIGEGLASGNEEIRAYAGTLEDKRTMSQAEAGQLYRMLVAETQGNYNEVKAQTESEEEQAVSAETNTAAQQSEPRTETPDFSDRSLDEPISEAEFRAAYTARVAREAAAERAKTQADTDLGNMLSGELTNGRADEIAKSQSLANAFEALTGEKLTGTIAEKRKQLKAMQTFAAEKLRDARADARMTALKTADTREKMRAAVGTAGQAVYDAGYAAGVAAYKLRGFAGDSLLAPSELYNANFGAYYRQGYQGDAFDFPGNAVIGEADARRIFEAGRRDAKADTYLNAAERSAFEHGVSAEEGATARRLSQVLDREILFIDADADFHGCTIDGVIYLGAKSERSVLATVAHEYTHLLEGKGLYKKLRDFVFGTLAGEGATAEDLRAAKRAEHELYAGLDDAQIDREIVAEFVETRLLTDEQVMRAVVRREGKSFAHRLLDTLRGLIEKVKAALHIGNADAEQLKMLERGRDILAEVIRSEETSEAADGAISFAFTGTNKSGVREYKTDFPSDMPQTERERLFKERLATIFNLGAVELKTDVKKIKVQADRFTYQKNKYGDIGESRDKAAKINALYDLADILETSKFKSSNIESSYADSTNDPKNAAHKDVKYWYKFENHIMLDGVPYKVVFNIRDKGKEQYQYLIEFSSEGSLSTKKKATASDTAAKEQLRAIDNRPSDTTVSQKNSGVNSKYTQNSKNDADIDGFSVGGVETDSEGNTLSEAQQKFFSDSLVTDEDGALLPVYHATDSAEFTVFDKSKLGYNTDGNTSDEGMAATAHVGFWFNTKDLTGEAGSRAEKVYLNLTNPYELTSLDALAEEIKALGEGETPAEMGEAYATDLWLRGYDGIEIQNDEEFGGTSYVAFDENQIKRTTNKNPTKDADIRFSVGGIKAKTADVGRLADAERMEQGGADSETVRRETGWYRGYDGKWRFEIDDSKMRFINHREESRRTWKLDELIRHDALFAAYPELRDYTVLNFGISDDVEAAFYPGLNRITLDPRLSRAEKRAALIHEIQHAIQLIEGFTAGATTDYWRDSLKTAEEKQLELRLRDFAAPDIFFEADMRKLLEGTPAAERDAAQTALEKHYGEAPVREYVDLYNRLRDLRAEREQDAERAYRNTAGEIEASDVANRIGLSEMQRAETRPDIDREEVRFSNEHPMFTMEARQTDADADTEVSDADKRFAPVESAIKLLKSGADLWRTLRETGASPREIALRMTTRGESDTAIRELTGLYRDALGVWTYDKAWFNAHVPDIADTRELRAGYKLGTVDEQLLGLAPEEVKASRRRLLDSAKLPADADAARVRQTAANLHRGLRPTAAEFAEDRKTAAAKEAARLITAEKVPSADAAIRTGALLADIADVLEKKKVRAETITRLTAQVRGENGAWETDNAAMTKIIRAGSKQLDVQDFTDFLFENAKELTESSYNSQYGHKETYALDKLGVQIQNPIVDIAKYGTKPSELIANEREQEELKRYIENEYASAAHPSPAERADARDVATGIRTLGQISQDSRREVVLDLVYANLARRGLRDNGIETFYMVQKQRYAEELAQNIFKTSIEPGKKAVQQWRLTANTALRNNRMVFGEEIGRYLNETIFEKVVENEAERQRFMQREIDKIRKLELTKLESQAVQMLAEDTKESRLAFYELLKDKGKNLDVEKCRAAVTVFRACYNLYYDAINEFLVMHGYKPIGFQKNYMPRLQKEADVSALRERLNALGIETEEVTELPAEIAGRTETFKPGKKYNPFFEHRTSKENKNVQYDALGGFDSYITYLSEVLYHTDDIQKLRTLAGALRERYASGAVSKNIAELKEQLYSPDPDKSFADIEAKLTAAYDEVKLNNYFGTYATWLDDYTNNIAGKQTSFDRAFEYNIGRKTLNLGKRLNNTYSAAVIVGNLSSAFNQTVQLPFALTECGIRNMTRAFVDMLPGSDRLNKTAEFDKKSTFLAGKRGVDYASERAWNEKVTAAGGKFFETVDMAVTRLILRAKYYQVTEANPNIGFDAAIREADRYISAMVGNRMKGAKPVLFNQKNVITRTLAAFQLEQLNFAEYVARDVPAKYRAYYKAHDTHATVRKIARELISALINVFVFNRLAELLYGQTPAAGDVLGILVDSLGAGWNLTGNDFLLTLADDLCRTMTGERKLGTKERGDFSTQNALGAFGDEVGDDVPLVNNILAMLGVTNSKLPLPQIKAVTKAASGDFKGAAAQIPSDLATWVPFGSQVKKTARGVKLIADKGMYSSSGKLMFASDMNMWDSIRAVLFGPTANEEYRESFFGGRYLSAEETALWQQMRAAGGKPEESFDALQDVYNAGAAVREADPDAPSAEVKAAKVEKIDNLPLNGRLKALLLYGDVATTNEKAVMDALEVTLQVDHMKVYRFMSGFVLQEKVADKREYLKHDLILTDAEKATVYYHYFANDDAQDFIDELRRRGGKDADIYKVLAASYGREEEKITSADRATAIADSSLPASAKEEAMYELISDELHDKYTAVQDAGGSVDEFLAAYAATRGITSDKDRAGNTVALSKARKMKKAIDAAVPDAPKKVRRALYSAFGVSKSVWY